jgi:hypothetical protein
LNVSLPTHQAWREIAVAIHSTIFAYGVSPKHLCIGGHWDDGLFESLMQQHPAFLQAVQTFSLADVKPTERMLRLLSSLPSLETLEMHEAHTWDETHRIPECEGFNRLTTIQLTGICPIEAYMVLNSLNPKAPISHLILDPVYNEAPGLDGNLFPDSTLLHNLVSLELKLELWMQDQLSKDTRRSLGSFRQLQNLTIGSYNALGGDDFEWRGTLRNLTQLRTLSLAESPQSFRSDSELTLGFIEIALECCPMLVSLAGSFDLNEDYIPYPVPTKKHLNLEVVDLGFSYFRWYTKDSDDFAPPEHWVSQAVDYLTSLTEYPCEIRISDNYLTYMGDSVHKDIEPWHSRLVQSFRAAVKLANFLKTTRKVESS